LRYVIHHMNPRDIFQIVSFSNSTEFLFHKPQPVNMFTSVKAQHYIDDLHADGGTLMADAVEKICKMPTDKNRLRIVTLMTDGYVGDDDEIVNFVRKFRGSSRWFTFGTGNSVNRALIDGVAKAGGGEPDYVYLNASADKVGKKFYDRIANPLLTDVSLRFSGVSVSEVFPAQPSDVWANRPLYFQGRYAKGGTGTVTLSGFAGGKRYSKTMSISLPNVERENSVIEPIWARAKVDQLMEDKDVNDRREATQSTLENEITSVALAHHIMTQYTSFVAVDESTHRLVGDSKTVDVPVEVPEGIFGWLGGGGGRLCGAPVDPRYGQSNEVGHLADYGYDTARDIARLITLITGMVCIALTIWRHVKNKSKGSKWKRLLQSTIVLIAIPLAVHLLGTFLIINLSGLRMLP
jgi:Ca-activated chloride channel homolog